MASIACCAASTLSLTSSSLLSRRNFSQKSFAKGSQFPSCRVSGPLRVVSMAATGAPGVEPELSEEKRISWETVGTEYQQNDTFKYGKWDGAHTWHKGDDGTFMENWNAAQEAAGAPQGLSKWLAYGFPHVFFPAFFFGASSEILFGITVLYLFAYIGVEMAKPAKPTNYEPQVYDKYK